MALSKSVKLEDIATPDEVAPLFQPLSLGPFELKTRAVYAPLTRCRSIGAVPSESAPLYYARKCLSHAHYLPLANISLTVPTVNIPPSILH